MWLLSSLLAEIILGVLLLGSVQLIWSYFKSPLRKIPGPFAAKFTNLWRLLDTYGGRAELTQRSLHEKYGPAVRIGPNLVSLSDPALLRTIYNARGDYLKTELYAVNDIKVGRTIISNAFSTRSNEIHSQHLRPVSKFYKMASILAFEPLINNTLSNFFGRLDELFVDGNKECEMDEWLLFFAWDVIFELTFSKPMGYLEKGEDFNGLLRTADKVFDYFATVSQIPVLDHWLAKNPVKPVGPPSFDAAAMFSFQQSMARQQGSDGKSTGQRDMLDDFLEVKRAGGLDDNGVVSALLINVIAGADTTAILLRAVVYFVLKNPRVHKKLQRELDDAKLSTPISYEVASKLPYLDAVIKEASRMHPGVELVMERVVPEGGLKLGDSTVLPPGTAVGMNPAVIHRNKLVFGQDADSFVPERWLRYEAEGETEDEYQTRLSAMKHADLTFGAGKRMCLGKNITLVESYKCLATLFLKYDMSLVHPEKEWKIQNSWFVRQSGIDVKIQRRGSNIIPH